MGKPKPWTSEEDQTLKDLLQKKLTFEQIEMCSGISKSRAHRRANELGISRGKYFTPTTRTVELQKEYLKQQQRLVLKINSIRKKQNLPFATLNEKGEIQS